MPAGGLSASASTSVASKSGDAGAGLMTPFNYNGAFQVGGSGGQTQNAAATNAAGGLAGNNLALYVGLGIAGVLGLGALLIYARR
jgi:hypothetical protein